MTDNDGKITRFLEKPSWGQVFSDTINTGIYILEPEILDLIPYREEFDFSKDLFPMMLSKGMPLYGYIADGYWRDVGTITSLWDANMDMLSTDLINLFDPDWPISSRSPICPPHFTGPDAKIIHSIVTEGCEIYGEVENSVLSSSVNVGKGAKVLYSVLMPGAVVGDGAVVEYAIVGENTVIGEGAHIGAPPDGTDAWGVATCGPDIAIRAGAVVPASAMIYTGEEV